MATVVDVDAADVFTSLELVVGPYRSHDALRARWAHLAFGHGAHFYADGPPARAGGRITREWLLDRMSDIRILEEAHGPPGGRRYCHHPTHSRRGPQQLHIESAVA